MSVETYLVYLGVLAAFFITPPDTSQLLIISNSLRHGLRRTTATIAGDLSANVLQMTAAAFGLTAIVAASSDAIWIIKWVGVAYLAWIGLRLLLSRETSTGPVASRVGRKRVLFRQGFLTSSANPYAVVFFGALFPQFIDPAQLILPQLVVLGATYLVVDGLVLLAWGWVATRTLGKVKGLTAHWMNKISGSLMIAAAGLLAGRDLTTETNR